MHFKQSYLYGYICVFAFHWDDAYYVWSMLALENALFPSIFCSNILLVSAVCHDSTQPSQHPILKKDAPRHLYYGLTLSCCANGPIIVHSVNYIPVNTNMTGVWNHYTQYCV